MCDLASPDGMQEAANVASSRNAANGRRGLNLPLPLVWTDHGVYRLQASVKDGPLLVSLIGCKEMKPIPEDALAGQDRDKLFIRSNFSERKACLASHVSDLDWPLSLLFADTAIRRELAVSIASPATPTNLMAELVPTGLVSEPADDAPAAGGANLQVKQEASEENKKKRSAPKSAAKPPSHPAAKGGKGDGKGSKKQRKREGDLEPPMPKVT